MPNYVTDDKEEDEEDKPPPRYWTQSTTTQMLLSCMETHQPNYLARQLANQKFLLLVLCELVGAVIDVNSELLEYRHLVNRDEYKQEWGFQFGNEVGRLAQGITGREEGTNTMFS